MARSCANGSASTFYGRPFPAGMLQVSRIPGFWITPVEPFFSGVNEKESSLTGIRQCIANTIKVRAEHYVERQRRRTPPSRQNCSSRGRREVCALWYRRATAGGPPTPEIRQMFLSRAHAAAFIACRRPVPSYGAGLGMYVALTRRIVVGSRSLQQPQIISED